MKTIWFRRTLGAVWRVLVLGAIESARVLRVLRPVATTVFGAATLSLDLSYRRSALGKKVGERVLEESSVRGLLRNTK